MEPFTIWHVLIQHFFPQNDSYNNILKFSTPCVEHPLHMWVHTHAYPLVQVHVCVCVCVCMLLFMPCYLKPNT